MHFKGIFKIYQIKDEWSEKKGNYKINYTIRSYASEISGIAINAYVLCVCIEGYMYVHRDED